MAQTRPPRLKILIVSLLLISGIQATVFAYPPLAGIFGYQHALDSGGPTTISVSTDKNQYLCGQNVQITADVYFQVSGIVPAVGVQVVFEVHAPSGGVIASGSGLTGLNGFTEFQFTLPTTCQSGSYQAFASTTYPQPATSSVIFTVSGSTLSTHVTISLATTDSNGNPESSFSRGQNVLVKVVVTNDGSTSLTNIYVLLTVYDSNNAPIFFGISINSIASGQQTQILIGTTLVSSLPTGTFNAQVIVLTNFLAHGGTYVPDGAGTISFLVT